MVSPCGMHVEKRLSSSAWFLCFGNLETKLKILDRGGKCLRIFWTWEILYNQVSANLWRVTKLCFSSPHHSAKKVSGRLDEQREIYQTEWKFNETMMVWFKYGTPDSRTNGKLENEIWYFQGVFTEDNIPKNLWHIETICLSSFCRYLILEDITNLSRISSMSIPNIGGAVKLVMLKLFVDLYI